MQEKSTDCRNGENEDIYICRRAIGHTRVSSETFKIRTGCRIIPYCEELSNVLQNVQHTWLSPPSGALLSPQLWRPPQTLSDLVTFF